MIGYFYFLNFFGLEIYEIRNWEWSAKFLGFYVQRKDHPTHKTIVDDIIYDALALQLALDRHCLVLHHICKVHCHQRGGVVNLQAEEQ